MIPPLVALIATADEARQRDLATALLRRIQEQGNAASLSDVPLAMQQLPQLPLRRLVPDPPQSSVIEQLLRLLTVEQLVPGLSSRLDGSNVQAGLYMVHDFLDHAHEIAQAADEPGPNTSAAYWHGIVHRREPDYDNARYWFRRVGSHPVFVALSNDAAALLSDAEVRQQLQFDRILNSRGRWDPLAFIDLCEQCGREWTDRARAAARLQEIEIRRLLEYSCRAAQGQKNA